MSDALPVFPLNTVLFPGMLLPLHIFEDRYRALVADLLGLPETVQRQFAVVAIREGYEVGSRGVQSVHRLGCSARLTSVEPYDDGRFDIEVRGDRPLRIDAIDSGGEYLAGDVTWLKERPGEDSHPAAARAMLTYQEYRSMLGELHGRDALPDDLPSDPTGLSYHLGATCLLTQGQRQALLEAEDTAGRLVLATSMMRAEMAAIRAIPSLPATEVARTGWSPN
ncbi:MAG: LON peptidase substrate-binding domain-containing protein [Nocardioidaceae bacterium]